MELSVLRVPFWEFAPWENQLPITNFLDLIFHLPKLETEHNVVPGRPPTKLVAFLFFDN